MAFNFGRYYDLASWLQAPQPAIEHWMPLQGSRHRASVSKLYYSVFKLSFSYLVNHTEDHIILASQAIYLAAVGRNNDAIPFRQRALDAAPGLTIEQIEEEARGCNIHGHVISRIQSCGALGTEAADALRTLRTKRNEADYNPFRIVDNASVQQALTLANRVRDAVMQLFAAAT